MLCFIPVKNVYAGFELPFLPTDQAGTVELISFFDLRDRESFIQITSTGSEVSTAHVQIFDVSNNCNENDFFDLYTINDTHVYNLRDIQTNDGNPSGVVLPDGAYGFVYVSNVGSNSGMIGNFRIIDEAGYEYRTNSQGITADFPFAILPREYTLNFNSNSGVIFSDVVGIVIGDAFNSSGAIADPNNFITFDVDIINNNETLFSCRDVIFSCVDQDSPLLEELLENGNANVASFEYGINNVIPHSKGGELLCPGNTIDEGVVRLGVQFFQIDSQEIFSGYIGLNNGNGRGSMDSWWLPFQQGEAR